MKEGDATTRTAEYGSESYFRHLCQNAGVALIGTDLLLNIRTWNTAAGRMFGAAPERMSGTPILAVIPQEKRQAAGRMLRQAIETGQTYQFEFEHRDDRGERRELAGTIASVTTTDGSCLGASLCIRDITRRIKLQDALNESRKMAALGELAGSIVHHFNNILGGAITSIDFATTSRDAELTNRVLQQTSQALQRATGLLCGLQAFAEGDTRADDLADFTELIVGIADEVERIVRDTPIEFTLNLPQFPVMPVPKVPVSTLLRNIAQNAIEAMPDGGKLQISVSADEDWIATRITDTGRGLDETAIKRVFEPFWSTKGRLSTSTGEGTGLGLAIAHGLAQMIGGAISVASQPGKGACFTVSIPRPHTASETGS